MCVCVLYTVCSLHLFKHVFNSSFERVVLTLLFVNLFLTHAGGDKLVRLWGYDEGHCYFIGVAHSGSITRVAVTPDKSAVVTVGTEGGIFVWQYSAPESLADL